MKREIKFRAWHKKNKIMVPWEKIIKSKELLQSIFGNEHYKTAEPMYIWELMQFTGLSDKNGREVYEDDVLNTGFSNYVVEHEESKSYTHGHGSGETNYHIGFNFGGYYGHPSGHEVIGNIYENPELINK